jgi:hypothetical protein
VNVSERSRVLVASAAPLCEVRDTKIAPRYSPGHGRGRARRVGTTVNDEGRLQRQLESAAVNLSREFGGTLSSEDVDRYFAEELEPFSGARVRDFVPILAERRTRSRLRALSESP